jgi:hypothetical protein
MINQELEKLYNTHKSNLTGLFDDEFDGPLLMYCWEEEFKASDYKILFVGKELNGWIGYFADDIDLLRKRYEDFGLCTQEGSNRNSRLWKYMYDFNSRLNPACEGKKNFMWTNVSKCCTWKGKGLDWESHQKIVANFNVLECEIKILQPDVIIFFTGPYYDDKIRIQITDDLVFRQVVEHIPSRELARLENINLPYFTYRLYHPDYMDIYKPDKRSHLDIIENEIKTVNVKA